MFSMIFAIIMGVRKIKSGNLVSSNDRINRKFGFPLLEASSKLPSIESLSVALLCIEVDRIYKTLESTHSWR